MGTVATGIAVDFLPSGFLAEVVEVTGPDITRPDIDMAHHLSTWRDYEPGELPDGGNLTLNIAFDPAIAPPIKGTKQTVTISWPDSAATPWTFLGYLNSFTPSGPLDERLTAAVSIKVAGEITFS